MHTLQQVPVRLVRNFLIEHKAAESIKNLYIVSTEPTNFKRKIKLLHFSLIVELTVWPTAEHWWWWWWWWQLRGCSCPDLPLTFLQLLCVPIHAFAAMSFYWWSFFKYDSRSLSGVQILDLEDTNPTNLIIEPIIYCISANLNILPYSNEIRLSTDINLVWHHWSGHKNFVLNSYAFTNDLWCSIYAYKIRRHSSQVFSL